MKMRGVPVLLVFAFSGEGKLVLRLSIWDLVDTEPLVGGSQETREVALDILDVVEFGCQRIIHVNDDDFPIGLLFVQKGHDTEDLDLFHLPHVTNQFSNLADIQRIVVSPCFSLWVDHIGVFPGLPGDILQSATSAVPRSKGGGFAYAREGAVIPEVTFMREAVPHVTKLTFFHILFDGVQEFFLANLPNLSQH
jgi:hypothetical protein